MLNWKLQSIRQEDWLKKEIHNKDLLRTLSNLHDGTFSENANAATCSVKNGVLKNFAKYTGKHLCQSLLFNKVAGFRPTNLLKKRLWHRCFPVNFTQFLRTPFYRTSPEDCFWKWLAAKSCIMDVLQVPEVSE